MTTMGSLAHKRSRCFLFSVYNTEHYAHSL
uniref:Uncharacterized protein n=1 Tax=Anguilla anguilla TaxID=7936 RepID=A0A0E9TSX1_ANGAN